MKYPTSSNEARLSIQDDIKYREPVDRTSFLVTQCLNRLIISDLSRKARFAPEVDLHNMLNESVSNITNEFIKQSELFKSRNLR